MSIYEVEQHPELVKRWWELNFLWLSYIGGQDYHYPTIPYSPIGLNRVLIRGVSAQDTYTLSLLERHPREEDADFVARIERAVFVNLVAPIARARAAHILGHNIVRPAFPWLEAYLRDVDLAGNGRLAFMRRGELFAQNFGACFCVTETPATPEGIEVHSKADADAIGQRPVSQWITPLDVVNWDLDYRGEFNWIVLRYREQSRLRPGGFGQARDASGRFAPRAKPTIRYRHWYRDHYEDWRQTTDAAGLYTTAPVIIGEGPNPIGRVPVDVLVNLPSIEGNNPLGTSATLAAAYVNRTIYNLQSWVHDQCANQTFAQLAVPGPRGKVTNLQLGTSRYIGYDPSAGGGMPGYFAPPAEPTRLLLDVAKDLAQQLREVASMSRGRPEQSVQPRSADALVVERVDIEAELAEATSEAEGFEARNLRTVALWAGEDPSTVTVEYRKPGKPAEPMVQVPAQAEGTEAPGEVEGEGEMPMAGMNGNGANGHAEVAAAADPEGSAKAAPDAGIKFFQYEIEGGLVTLNEVRASKGLGPMPDGDLTLPEYRAKHAETFAVATTTQTSGGAEKLTGLVDTAGDE